MVAEAASHRPPVRPTPQHTQEPSRQRLHGHSIVAAEVEAIGRAYLAAFNSGDVAALDAVP